MSESIFIQELKQDKTRYDKFLKAKELYLITEFDEEIKSRLRKIYWGGFFQALLYLYYMPTDFETIGNKVELLTASLEGEEFQIVHALTNSSRNTPFYKYDHKHLDFNSFIEVKRGRNIWVYDLYSMLKFDKSVYYSLESPQNHLNDATELSLLKVTSSEKLKQVKKMLAEEIDYSLHLKEIYLKTMEKIPEMLTKDHPFYDFILKEIELQKQVNNFDEMKREIKALEEERRASSYSLRPYKK